MADDKPYTVGYGRPPKHAQFKPGLSGNRRGRKRGSVNRRPIVERVAHELSQSIESGQKLQRSTLELVLMTIRNKALEGRPRAVRTYRALLEKYAPAAKSGGGRYLIVPETVSEEEWEARVEKTYERQKALEREYWEQHGPEK